MTYYEDAHPDYFSTRFTRADWLEAIGNEQVGGESVSLEGGQATIAVKIPWAKRLAFARFVHGWSYVSRGSLMLRRENPVRHPQWPHLVGANVSFQGISPVGVAGVGTKVAGAYPDSMFQAKYANCVATVTFTDRPWVFRRDHGGYSPAVEGTRNTYLEPTPTIEVISAEGLNNIKFASGPNSGAAVPAPFGTLMSKCTYVLNWMWVPHEYISTSDYPVLVAAKINACVGRVNTDTFFGFPPGTLLLQAPSFQPFRFPIVTSDRTEGFFGWNVRLPIQHFDPPRGGTTGLLLAGAALNVGIIDVSEASIPFIETGDTVTLAWAGGFRENVTVGAKVGNSFVVSGGTGTDLPAVATLMVVYSNRWRGHQLVPRRQDLLWYGAVREDGSSKIYSEAAFANIFANASAT